MSAHELMWLRRSRPTKRPINQHPLSASPLNDANLMAGLHAGDRVDIVPTHPSDARLAAVQHLGDQAAKRWLPITAQTPCEVHPGYPGMQPLTLTVNTVLPPAAATNRDSTIAPHCIAAACRRSTHRQTRVMGRPDPKTFTEPYVWHFDFVLRPDWALLDYALRSVPSSSRRASCPTEIGTTRDSGTSGGGLR